MAVSVKAYLNNGDESPEIRRFSIPQEASANFEYLVGKIRQVYPSLLRKDFKLYWKDNEGEYVAFSSDEELVMALGSSNSEDHFRLYIEVEKQGSTDGSSPNKKEKHPGVVCDVCDKEIEGTRFKCLSCRDYDLCSSCEASGFHAEHQMLRIRTPAQNPLHGIWHSMFGRGSRGHHRGRGSPSGRHGHHGCGGPQSHPQHGPPDWAKYCKRGAGGPEFVGPWGFGSWGPNTCNETTKDKKSENSQEDGAPAYPTFKDIFDQVSETLAEQFGAGFPNSWEPEKAGQSPQTEEKEKAPESKEERPDVEQKDEEGDAQMPQNESFIVVDKTVTEEKGTNPQAEQRRRQEEEFQRKLNEAMKQMETMGFKNEGGWLSQLVIAKDFDIGKVIDTLQSTD